MNEHSFQLLRLIMIDSYARNREVEIKLDGHITINGENGVGKTTLLRLIPMFFGESPSRIIRGDAVTEKFGRYYFPSTASYVIYEYLRRDTKVLAVIHARGHEDGIAYRFIDSPYKRELFFNESSVVQTGDLHRHLDKQGVFDSGPLALAAYRQVIQNTAGREHKALASRFSFTGATGKLTHMERVVTGIFQRATTFYDLRRMIVASILDGDESFSMQTSRKDLSHWVTEYEAHFELEKKRAVMDELEVADHSRRLDEATFARLHAQYKLLIAHYGEEREAAEVAHKAAYDDKMQAEAEYGRRLHELSLKRMDAEALVKTTGNDLKMIDARREAYTRNRIEEKVAKVDALPSLRSNRQPLVEQLARFEGQHQSITGIFSRMEQDVREGAAKERSRIDTDRIAVLESAQEKKEALTRQHLGRAKEISARQNEEQAKAAETVNARKQEKSGLEVEVRTADADPAIKEALERQRDSKAAADDTLDQLRSQGESLNEAWRKARDEFSELETRIGDAEFAIDREEAALLRLMAGQSASADSLLGFLRASKPDWVTSIGRVLSDETLLRTDLSPSLGEGDTLYGLSIDLNRIEMGRFADEERLQHDIGVSRARLESGRKFLGEEKSKLEKASAAVKAARSKADDGGIAFHAAKRNKTAAEQRVSAAMQQVTESRNLNIARAKNRLNACEEQLRQAEATLSNLKKEHAAELKEHQDAFSRAETELKAWQQAQFQELDRQRGALGKVLHEKLETINRDRNESLRQNGISPDIINGIRNEIKALDDQIKAIEGFEKEVGEYRNWLSTAWAGREAKVDELRIAETRAKQLKAENEGLLQERHRVMEQKEQALRNADQAINEASAMERGASAQMTNVASWPVDQDVYAAGHDATLTLTALNRIRQQTAESLKESKEKISKCVNELSRQMTLYPGTGSERYYLDALRTLGYPQTDTYPAWIERFRYWFNSEFATNRTALLQNGKVMAANISQFWKNLRDFKSKVTSFSTDLSANLQQGRVFDTIADVSTEIRTYVDTQNYWDAVETLHHEFDAWHVQGESALPPDSFIQAAKRVVSVLSEDKGLIADPVDLLSLKISARVNNEPTKTASNERELEGMSSNGLSFIILCIVLIGFVNRIRRKNPVIIPFLVDELGDLSFNNAQTLLELFNQNSITIISAFPDTDTDMAWMFNRNYKVSKEREVSLIDLADLDLDEDEVAHAL